MSLCKEIKSLLVLYLENELEQNEMTKVKSHLEECEECQIELRNIIKISNVLELEKNEIPTSYSSEFIVNINNRIHPDRFPKRKLVSITTFLTVTFLIIFTIMFNNTKVGDNIFSDEYLLYQQYASSDLSVDLEIFTQSEEITNSIMPDDYYKISQEYILENTSIYNSENYDEIFSELDESDFEMLIANLKNIKI